MKKRKSSLWKHSYVKPLCNEIRNERKRRRKRRRVKKAKWDNRKNGLGNSIHLKHDRDISRSSKEKHTIGVQNTTNGPFTNLMSVIWKERRNLKQ